MTDLSPAAQAVLYAAAQAMECPDGFLPYERELMAAALRAASDQVVPSDPNMPERWEVKDEIRADLLAIADELENHQ